MPGESEAVIADLLIHATTDVDSLRAHHQFGNHVVTAADVVKAADNAATFRPIENPIAELQAVLDAPRTPNR
jgi:hypothetical protein